MPALSLLEWDSRHFDIAIVRLDMSGSDPVRDVQNLLASVNAKCVISRVSSSDFQGASLLGRLGFQLMDIRLRLDMDLSTFSLQGQRSTCMVREFKPSDLRALRGIARTSFRTGHFRVDKRFDQEKVDEMYGQWVEKCAKEKYQLVVAEHDSKTVGFVAGKDEETGAHIELVAVDPSVRSRGVGYDTMMHYLRIAKQKHRRADVGVHLDNVPAIRFYERLGFAVNQGELTFHRWID